MSASFLTVHFQDEAPKFGSGRRLVYLDKVGRQWVTLVCPFRVESQRIKRQVWDGTLARSAIEQRPIKSIVRRNLQRNVGRDAPKTRKQLRKRIEAAL